MITGWAEMLAPFFEGQKMAKVSAILLRPLDGNEIGSTREFDPADFQRLEACGAVKAVAGTSNKKQVDPENKAKGAVEKKASATE